MIVRLYLWINDQRGEDSSVFHDEGEEMNGPVACTTEYFDSYTHFSLTPNIPSSVVRHAFAYDTGKWGVQGHFADSLHCSVAGQ